MIQHHDTDGIDPINGKNSSESFENILRQFAPVPQLVRVRIKNYEATQDKEEMYSAPPDYQESIEETGCGHQIRMCHDNQHCSDPASYLNEIETTTGI